MTGTTVTLTTAAAEAAQEGPWFKQWKDKAAAEHASGVQPPERMASRIIAAVEMVMATRLWLESDPAQRTRLMQAGGQGVGTVWSAMPEGDRWLTSAQWRVATQMRLGLWNTAMEMRCQNPTPAGVCGKLLGRGPLHCLDCLEAPSRIRLHKGVAVTLADQMRRAQADVALEQAIPELGRWWLDAAGTWQCQDAVMDLAVCWPGAWMGRTLIDVTVRDPDAQRYQPGAARRPGAAAAKAGEEKEARYPEHHGAKVRTLAYEPLGRLGEEGENLLRDLAADAAAVAADRTAAPALLRRWRHALEHTLTAGVADAVLRAAGRAGAEAWERGAVPRLGRQQRAAPELQEGPTQAQLHRAEANRQAALARREERLQLEAAAAAAAPGQPSEAAAAADEEDALALGVGLD